MSKFKVDDTVRFLPLCDMTKETLKCISPNCYSKELAGRTVTIKEINTTDMSFESVKAVSWTVFLCMVVPTAPRPCKTHEPAEAEPAVENLSGCPMPEGLDDYYCLMDSGEIRYCQNLNRDGMLGHYKHRYSSTDRTDCESELERRKPKKRTGFEKPSVGETYFVLYGNGRIIQLTWHGRFLNRNHFKSYYCSTIREICERKAYQRKLDKDIDVWIAEHDPITPAEWADGILAKRVPQYSHNFGKWLCTEHTSLREGDWAFRSKQICQAFVDEFSDRILKLWNWRVSV